MFGLHRGAGSAGIDGEVLAELRAIREEIHSLSERVAGAATREDLDDYVTKEVFDAHVASGQRATDLWNRWLPIGIAVCAFIWAILGPYVHFAAR
jgi:hypothetical protein